MPDPAQGDGEVSPAPGEPTTDQVRGIFSRIARTYDLVNIVASLGVDRLWRRVVVRLAQVRSEDRVLDLAAGTGGLTLAIARRGRPAEVVSTDFVPEMLDIARRKAALYDGPTCLSFQTADAQALPFEAGRFDIVTVGFGVRNLPDRAACFAEVLRVLGPAGRFVVLEFSRPPFTPWRAVYHAYLRWFVPFLGWLFARDRAAYTYLNDSIRGFPDQRSLASELEGAGFSQVTWRNLSGGIVAVHVGRKSG